MRMMFADACRVVEYRPKTENGITEPDPQTLYEALPCKISRRRSPAGATVRGACAVMQEITLLIPRGVHLPLGTTVELGGYAYRHCGASAEYPTHNEYRLIWEGCA